MESSATFGKMPKALIKDDCLDRTVTITVLSCDGVVAKRYESKTKKWKNRQVTKSPTSLAASFSQNLSAGDSFLTHVPSMPMEHLDTSCMKPGKAKSIPQPIVSWPSMDVGEGGDGDEAVCKDLSTLRFTRTFRPDVDNDNASSTTNLLPETISIKLSLSRKGKLISLGRADVVIISGEEKGDSYIDVPVSSTIKRVGVSSPIKKSSKDRIPMVRIKGDDMQFGLKGDSILRVLVSVADVQEQDGISGVQGNEILRQDTEDITTDDDECEVNDVTFELDDKYENFIDFLNEETVTLQLDEGKVDEADVDEDKSTDALVLSRDDDENTSDELTLRLDEVEMDDADVDEDEETASNASALPQDEADIDEDKSTDVSVLSQDDKENASDELILQLDEGKVDDADVDEEKDVTTKVSALPQDEADASALSRIEEKEKVSDELNPQLDDVTIAEAAVDEDEETATDAAALPEDEAKVDGDLVGEQKEMLETTDEEQEENTENDEAENDNEGIGAWFANLFGNAK